LTGLLSRNLVLLSLSSRNLALLNERILRV
jgi:hypothetical protein